MSAQRRPKVPDPLCVQDAVNVFDVAAVRTNENHQTKAWKILRAELERLRGYEEAAAAFAIEKAELRRSRDDLAGVLREMLAEVEDFHKSTGHEDVGGSVQCDTICAQIPKARRALAKVSL